MPLSRTPTGQLALNTGDLGFWNDNGLLELCGRIDRQVKVDGVRVDLASLEASLRSHPSVANAVAIADRDDAGTSLVAVVEPRSWAMQSLTSSMAIVLLPNSIPRAQRKPIRDGLLLFTDF